MMKKPYIFECGSCGLFSEQQPKKCICGDSHFIRTILEVGPDGIDN